ncbi:protein of unknown function [Candidatus Hydrogenisulfobacillus filiaventi]|uniref:Sulfurtransferase complex subunit TusB n=1 Tax=Candidatus Hydrogenisulfobacillus filiaventi TaxID=2707344 RepID=A0A6F8ZF35_9FIRM|nr:DsrH/TusB family sulfur metabolism protein [Bacillota bacterium]CAB1128304.1 protein of unknown function [Candidatus Hydrogenisulfobacillus filiaventi]
MTLVITGSSRGGELPPETLRLLDSLLDTNEPVTLLAYGDAVYALAAGAPGAAALTSRPGLALAAVAADLAARGLGDPAPGVEAIDYGQAVDRIFAAGRICTWV